VPVEHAEVGQARQAAALVAPTCQESLVKLMVKLMAKLIAALMLKHSWSLHKTDGLQKPTPSTLN